MDKNIWEYLKNLHALEIDRNTNWNKYGDLAKLLDYKWKENEKWHGEDKKQRKGKWVSYNTDMVNMVIFTLVASEETKHDLRVFAEKVMGAKNGKSV
tara:strand:- start:7759 stop:8049 length:291 start_codon:yes stop_codon:yes gene_type:complete